MNKVFKFSLGQHVCLKLSGEHGEVDGRAEYCHMENQYYVRYVDAQGCQIEKWIAECALVEHVHGKKSSKK